MMGAIWAFLSAPSQGPEWTGNWVDWAGAAAGVVLLAVVVAIVVLKI